MRILAAPDKFRFSAPAPGVADAIANGCWQTGHDCEQLPLADGGEGMLDIFGGPNRSTQVTGPLGEPVEARWRLDAKTAWIEMATASGLALLENAEQNRPLDATTKGTGELVLQAVSAGAKRIIVGLGGSATIDGGLGALNAIANPHRLAGIDLIAACDVDIMFCDAARVFGPQKGASPREVELLTRRLEGLVVRYRDELGVDVSEIPGAGAAGGLGGGLAAFGAEVISGFEFIAEELGLDVAMERCDAVITGEGRLDAQSFAGKVVGGVTAWAAGAGVPVVAVVGQTDAEGRAIAAERGVDVISLSDRFGAERSFAEPLRCIELAVAEWLLGQDR